ncbi:hypothetical protein Bca52824_069376 [Brassica carinata]|uniref:Uncharacterized protein n=1 Tax=Brassica carinata TaxID=52824 RepID=A0A8X7Q369_BRACI|nr:hypothetical protein Bca52824_069376 [Brassica carinata]
MYGSGSNSLRSAFSYCVQQVCNYDYHHYLCLFEVPLQMQMDDILESIKELKRYAEDTVSTLLYNTLQVGRISSTAANHTASHIGKASGLNLELAEKHGLLVKQVGRSGILLDIDSREGLCYVVFEIASVPNVHLLKARELAQKVHAEAKPVLLHSVPVQVLLDSSSA